MKQILLDMGPLAAIFSSTDNFQTICIDPLMTITPALLAT